VEDNADGADGAACPVRAGRRGDPAMNRPLATDPIGEAHRHWTEHGWGDSADGMAAVTSLFRAQQIMMARIDAILRPLDLTFARFEMLTLLCFTRAGALPLAKASSRLQVHPTSVTNTVERLGRAGLVQREAHPTDGRANLVAITPQGRALVMQAARELNREIFSDIGIPPEDIGTLNGILAQLRHDEGDFDEASPLLGGRRDREGSGA
jgi:DNA-binding MarR family transcriptional regulator